VIFIARSPAIRSTERRGEVGHVTEPVETFLLALDKALEQ